MAFAKGKRAYGYCDRTGFRYPLKDLVYEVNRGVRTGSRIGKDVVDPDHPQNFIDRVKTDDPQSLSDPRPDAGQAASRALWGWGPVGHELTSNTGSVGIVTVTTE